MRSFLIYLFLLVPFFSNGQQKNLDSIFKNAKVTGVQLLYSDNGKQQAFNYGKQKAGEKALINSASIFQAASLSKVVLAYISLKLYDRHILSLDTPLYHYYTYERIKNDTAAQKITARMVLHHLSGLPNWAGNPLSKTWINSALKTKSTPGSNWGYSGEGFMFLQFTIQNLLKQSLQQIAQQEVFAPLQMRSSSFIWQPGFEKNAVYGHDKEEQVTGRAEFFLPAGAYSLLTTATDYTKFLQAVMNGTGLSATTYQMMLNDTVSVKPANRSVSNAADHIFWGLGIGIQQNELGKAIWHWGDNDDFKCFFMAFPGKKQSLVYFTNSENGLKVTTQLLEHFFGKQNWWAIKWLDTDF
ncbi:serine hydrolase domain-containing protein [Ferruginibacter sp.]